MKTSFVYVAKLPAGRVKVGQSVSPSTRHAKVEKLIGQDFKLLFSK